MVVPKAKALLSKIETQGGISVYERWRTADFQTDSLYLGKFAEHQGIKTKSTHKIRKTYASNLSSKGVPLDAIREQLGHASLNTTLSYIFNPLTEQETYNLMVKAL